MDLICPFHLFVLCSGLDEKNTLCPQHLCCKYFNCSNWWFRESAQYWHHIRMDYTENRARAMQSTKHMHLICPLKISWEISNLSLYIYIYSLLKNRTKTQKYRIKRTQEQNFRIFKKKEMGWETYDRVHSVGPRNFIYLFINHHF
jgi:hypothetical protein